MGEGGALVARNVLIAIVVGAVLVLSPIGTGGPEAAATSDAASVTVSPPAAKEGSWRPFRRQGARPVGFDPCREITYVVRPRGGDEVARTDEELVHAAVAEAAAASGLRFRYAGRTDDVPHLDRRPGTGDPMWIGWADDVETDLFAPHAGAVGVGGSDVAVDRWGREVRTGGYAVVRRSTGDPVAVPVPGSEGVVLRHELAHALGLDHVDDPRELLFRDVTVVARQGYGPGDRWGLWELGAGQGC